MPVRNKIDRRKSNPDFRRRRQVPLPSIPELEQELYGILSPVAFTPLRQVPAAHRLRDRVLSLPVMTAIIVSLVLRNIGSLSDVLRLLESEGLLWVDRLSVSKQALSKRMQTLPAELFATMLDEVIAHYQKRWGSERERMMLLTPWQQRVNQSFSVVWTVDASTLDALKRTTPWLRQNTTTLGERLAGKLDAVVESFSGGPVAIDYSSDPATDELAEIDRLLGAVPENGLVVVDEGYFSFALFDEFTEQKKFFLTRMNKRADYRSLQVLSFGSHYRDEIIECGLHRSRPCRHRLRLVSILYNGTWYYYVTNVLDDTRLSAEDVVRLYRSRWRIETAFNDVKRLLGLSYLWVGDRNGAAMQLFATWIIYTLLINLCSELALHLGVTIDRISFEMVFRSLYYYSQARLRGETIDVVNYLAQHRRSFGIIKERRKHERQRDQLWALIWGYA